MILSKVLAVPIKGVASSISYLRVHTGVAVILAAFVVGGGVVATGNSPVALPSLPSLPTANVTVIATPTATVKMEPVAAQKFHDAFMAGDFSPDTLTPLFTNEQGAYAAAQTIYTAQTSGYVALSYAYQSQATTKDGRTYVFYIMTFRGPDTKVYEVWEIVVLVDGKILSFH